jgi:transposase-like protein
MRAITGVKCGPVRTRIQRPGSGEVVAAESASIKDVALSVGVSESTLERWRSEALANPAQRREWTPAAKFEACMSGSGRTSRHEINDSRDEA